MISIQQLINVAPFPQETKDELLAKCDDMSDSKKIEVESLCWALISQWYQNELGARQEKAMLEMAEGGKISSKEDFAKMSDTLFAEIVGKFKVEESQEDLEEVRAKLANLN
ncbi:MAG TPA: hypothetical protein VNA13_00710 [Xanthomonadales bacterium]|nr:hypothetical protein [Xanthomonadales bacterium]